MITVEISIHSWPAEDMEDILHRCCCASSLSCVWPFVTPRTVARQAPLSMGILQARILEWVAMPFSRGSTQLGDRTQVSRIAAYSLPSLWATREAYLHKKEEKINPYLLFLCKKK